ncbi:MAG: radical SAM protein [Polyangia bacterium]|nr:radical SAM protein [Polyangia bacterium]
MCSPKLRVMLVAPPGRCTPQGSFHAVPPEGIARLGAWLRQRSFDVFALDLIAEGYDVRKEEGRTVRYGLGADEAVQRITACSPDVICLSCLFTCIEPDVLEIARLCKDAMPASTVVLGGAHAAATASEILNKEPAVDLVALGEGEAALASLLQCLQDGGEVHDVAGFAYRTSDGGPKSNPVEDYIALDQLPLPAWDLLPVEFYRRANAPHFGVGAGVRFLPTTWSRGCAQACGFCLSSRMWGKGNHRKRSIEHVLDEARVLKEVHGVEELHVEDDCLLHDKDWFHSILDAKAERLPELGLDFSNGLDIRRVDADTASKLARAKTVRLGLAFDTGVSTRELEWTSKRSSLAQSKETLAALHDGGIKVVGFFMIGFPGQTVGDMNATVDYAQSLELDAMSLFIVTPFPGTRLHAHCEREGLLVPDADPRDFRFSTGLIRTAEFGPEDTERIRREGWEAFHRRRREDA